MAASSPSLKQSGKARVSARYMQTFLTQVERLPEGDQQAIRQAVPDGTLAAIDAAGVLAWLPGEVNLACTRAVSEQLGPERAQLFFRSLMLSTFESGLLRGLVEAALRIGFDDLTLYIPWVSRGFELMFRGCGRWTLVDGGPGRATIEIRGLPREYAVDPYWLTSASCALSALFELTRREGSASVTGVDPEKGRAAFDLRWTTG